MTAVDDYLASLDHPYKGAIEALRPIIRGVDPSIAEAIKWNAPSFHTVEHFATCNLRGKDGLVVVFHLGAKVRKPPPVLHIDDARDLLTWKGPDRATATFADAADVEAKREAIEAITRSWLPNL